MSNGQSKAPYIIICGGRIAVLEAKGTHAQLKAASDAAVGLTTYYGERCTATQTAPISQLQHDMMDNFNTWNKQEADAAIDEMFELLNELEDEMHG